MKQAARRLAARAGVEDPARAAWRALRPAVRRDLADRANIRRLVAWAVPADAHCVDVGAHEGDVLADLLRAAPAGRHLAYEPLPELAAGLRRAYPGVEVRERALADAAGERDFVRAVGNPGWSGFRERPTPGAERFERLRVTTERLDDALPEGFRPAFVKVDVEGAELEVLRGALETLRTLRPIVLFEHGRGSADHYGTTPRDVHDLLIGEAGLRIFDLDGRGPYTRADLEAAFAAGRPVNFVGHA